MGWLYDRFEGKYEGHDIVVEARSGPIKGRFALIVDGETQDMCKAVNGAHWLDGEIHDEDGGEGKSFRVRVVVKTGGLRGEEYWLEADGEERKLGEGFIL
jgi:hypothetical protein